MTAVKKNNWKLLPVLRAVQTCTLSRNRVYSIYFHFYDIYYHLGGLQGAIIPSFPDGGKEM